MNNNSDSEFYQDEPNRLEEIMFGMILQTKGSKDDLRSGITLLQSHFPRLVVTGIKQNNYGMYTDGWRAYLSFNILIDEIGPEHLEKIRGDKAPPKRQRKIKSHTKFDGGGVLEFEDLEADIKRGDSQ